MTEASLVVFDSQFNTPGDTEGWTPNFTVKGLVIADALGGSGESVLTSTGIQSQDDPMIFFPNATIALPESASGWEAMTVRIRQIGTDGVTPVAFSTAHTNFAMLAGTGGGSTPWPVLFWDTAGGNVTVGQVTESNEWNVFTFDLSAYTAGDIKANERMDPFTSSSFLGNFEIDYVTITAVGSAAVPEPSTIAMVMGSFALIGVSLRRRMKQ